jgi:hypothetical protein
LRDSNPLNPVYKLQSFTYVAPPPLPFIRDHIQISDIEGARPKKKVDKAERDGMKINDISGTAPKKEYKRAKEYDGHVYADVYAKDWKSKR